MLNMRIQIAIATALGIFLSISIFLNSAWIQRNFNGNPAQVKTSIQSMSLASAKNNTLGMNQAIRQSFKKSNRSDLLDPSIDKNSSTNDESTHLATATVTSNLVSATSIKQDIWSSYRHTDTHVISWTGIDAMNMMIKRYWHGNLFCESIDAARVNVTDLPILFNISFGCEELFTKSDLGTGNFLSVFFHMWMSAMAFENVEIRMFCPDAETQRSQLILPWFMGNFVPQLNSSRTVGLSANRTCGSYELSPIARMYKEMQYILRRLAIGLVGVPGLEHPAAKFAKDYLWSENPLPLPTDFNFTLQLPPPQRSDHFGITSKTLSLDDATIHFRCGDLMNLNHPSFGFMKFSGYTKYISPLARSIGIITQPFEENDQARKMDRGITVQERCRIVVMSLVDYIHEHFPDADVHIRNGPEETIALAFARMIMANQTVMGISSFGVFPAIGSFGTGYMRRPDFRKAPNQWLIKPTPIDRLADNVVLIDEPNIIMCSSIKKLWLARGQEGVLEWFWNDTIWAR